MAWTPCPRTFPITHFHQLTALSEEDRTVSFALSGATNMHAMINNPFVQSLPVIVDI